MAIDASIPLGVRPAQFDNPMNALARVMEIQNAQQSNDLNRLKMGEYQEGIERKNKLRGVLSQSYGRPEERESALLREGFLEEATKLGTDRRANVKADTEIEKAKLEKQLKTFEVAGQIMSGVRDQATWDRARMQAEQILGPEAAARLPAVYDPAVVQENMQKAMSVKDQLEQRHKELTFGETKRHNQATEGLTAEGQKITIRGQNLVDARGREANKLKEQEIAMGGKPPPGYRWNGPNLEAIPGGPGDKLPESQQKQVVGINNLSNAIAEYRAQLKDFGNWDSLSPDARATMGTKYNNMMLQAKEAYNLGVLNGPDLQILTSVITDPRSLKGAVTSKEALDKQASELDRMMKNMANISGQARQPQNKPGGATGEWGGGNDDPLGIRGGR